MIMKIPRLHLFEKIQKSITRNPVTLLLGPRQCGKTTLAKEINLIEHGTYFDLEDPETPLKQDIAKAVLNGLTGLVVIDEIQMQPSLFPLLRFLSDREPVPARFLILGSASPDLVRGASESLAGRVGYVSMAGFDLTVVDPSGFNALWERGGFPRSFLAEESDQSFEWRMNFIQSFLERDIPRLGIRIPPATLRRFWMMVAHFHGQILNASDFARSIGARPDTARRYLDILTGAFLVRQLPPWYENVGKRLVKSPKVYLRDSGVLHALLGLKDRMKILSHPKLGFSWEGFALEQVIRMTGRENEMFFYQTHGGAELDALLVLHGKKYGFEFKFQDAPVLTKSMRSVMEDLRLEKCWVIYPGERRHPLADRIEVVPMAECLNVLREEGLV
jgi:predicted AAA+ superfamily ATPase